MKVADKWLYDHCNEVHKSKLRRIKAESSHRINNSSPVIYKFRKNALHHKKSLEKFDFLLENNSFLKKITEIAKRPNQYKENSPKKLPKSLDPHFRKEFLNKISYESKIRIKKMSIQDNDSGKLKADDEKAKQLKRLVKKQRIYFSENRMQKRTNSNMIRNISQIGETLEEIKDYERDNLGSDLSSPEHESADEPEPNYEDDEPLEGKGRGVSENCKIPHFNFSSSETIQNNRNSILHKATRNSSTSSNSLKLLIRNPNRNSPNLRFNLKKSPYSGLLKSHLPN